MHTLGKVFLGLTLVCALAAIVLTAQLMNVRNSWMEKIHANRDRITKTDEEIAKKENELATLRAELARTRMTWDNLAVAATARVNPNGQVTVGVGPAQGFGVVAQGQEAPIVQAFAQTPQGPLYIGPFRVASGRDAQSLLEPVFAVADGEPATWPATNWRLWHRIPADAPSRLVDLKESIALRTEARDSATVTVAQQTENVRLADATLQARVRELNGNDQAPDLESAPEVSKGHVAALRDEEAARNAALSELDRLRRGVDEAYATLTRLLDENRRLVQALPQPEAAPAVSAR